MMLQALASASKGDKAGSVKILDQVGEGAKSDMEFSLWMAFAYAELGMKHETVYWLNAAIDEGLDGYPWLSHLRMFDKLEQPC